jgi:hypothetical protein
MKTFAIILRQTGKYYFRGQEASPRVRAKGAIIADTSLENAAFYIARGSADLYLGPKSVQAEWLGSHPLTADKDFNGNSNRLHPKLSNPNPPRKISPKIKRQKSTRINCQDK